MNLFIATHNDDEALWGAFTLMREKPLVVIVTDSWIQKNRGEDVTADQRWLETVNAMKVLGCPVIRLGIRDDVLDERTVKDKLSKFANFDKVYAPAIQGGNMQHDMVGKVAGELFDNVAYYTAYTQTETYTTGRKEIAPSPIELERKNIALDCYKSQLNNGNRLYFEAVKGKSEWII